jgi:hypothetical protein
LTFPAAFICIASRRWMRYQGIPESFRKLWNIQNVLEYFGMCTILRQFWNSFSNILNIQEIPEVFRHMDECRLLQFQGDTGVRPKLL